MCVSASTRPWSRNQVYPPVTVSVLEICSTARTNSGCTRVSVTQRREASRRTPTRTVKSRMKATRETTAAPAATTARTAVAGAVRIASARPNPSSAKRGAERDPAQTPLVIDGRVGIGQPDGEHAASRRDAQPDHQTDPTDRAEEEQQPAEAEAARRLLDPELAVAPDTRLRAHVRESATHCIVDEHLNRRHVTSMRRTGRHIYQPLCGQCVNPRSLPSAVGSRRVPPSSAAHQTVSSQPSPRPHSHAELVQVGHDSDLDHHRLRSANDYHHDDLGRHPRDQLTRPRAFVVTPTHLVVGGKATFSGTGCPASATVVIGIDDLSTGRGVFTQTTPAASGAWRTSALVSDFTIPGTAPPTRRAPPRPTTDDLPRSAKTTPGAYVLNVICAGPSRSVNAFYPLVPITVTAS